MTEPTPEAVEPVQPVDVVDAGLEPAAAAEPFDPERHNADLRKAKNEAKNLRDRLKELEPLAAEAQQLREASKTDMERLTEQHQSAVERAAKAEAEAVRLRAAVKHGISEDDFDLLGVGSEDEILARAERIAALRSAAAPAPDLTPAARRPVEQLKPGATPVTPVPVDESAYPDAWLSPSQRSAIEKHKSS